MVLEALAESGNPRRLSDLALELRLSKPIVHRALSTLVALGYATRDEANARYRATLKLYEIGRHLIAESNLHTATAGVMRELAEATGESVALGSCDHGDMVFLGAAEGTNAIKASVPVGSRCPALATAIGKAILAWRGPEALDMALAHAKRMTRASITSRTKAQRELLEVRRTGHALDRGEYHESIGGIACPIRDASGDVIAAICVWGEKERILGERREAIARMVMLAADKASRQLGAASTLDGAAAQGRSARAPSAGPRAPSGDAKKRRQAPRARGAGVRR